ncbi:MAG: hypothetical protein ISR95_03585 [Candidatus Marinimicrobia bacterium]|nr:hypothetical protein [FCB group bacterium]MBL7046696.1 hypothetical protein [Candidatus Neomarinimicrobiota bacterium]
MICWKVIIDEIDVSAFVPQESLDGLTIGVEGDHLFDFKTNDISFEMEIPALELFELDSNQIDQLKHIETNHRPVRVSRYGQKVFGGYIQSLSHQKNDHLMQIDAVSIDSLVVKTVLDTYQHVKGGLVSNSTAFETENPTAGGDTLAEIVARFIWLVNRYATTISLQNLWDTLFI